MRKTTTQIDRDFLIRVSDIDNHESLYSSKSLLSLLGHLVLSMLYLKRIVLVVMSLLINIVPCLLLSHSFHVKPFKYFNYDLHC